MTSFCCTMCNVCFLKISTWSIKYSLRYVTKCNLGCKTDSEPKNIWPREERNWRKLGPERVKHPSTQDLTSSPTSITRSFTTGRALSWFRRWTYNQNCIYLFIYYLHLTCLFAVISRQIQSFVQTKSCGFFCVIECVQKWLPLYYSFVRI